LVPRLEPLGDDGGADARACKHRPPEGNEWVDHHRARLVTLDPIQIGLHERPDRELAGLGHVDEEPGVLNE